jgi:hypothetical protein
MEPEFERLAFPAMDLDEFNACIDLVLAILTTEGDTRLLYSGQSIAAIFEGVRMVFETRVNQGNSVPEILQSLQDHKQVLAERLNVLTQRSTRGYQLRLSAADVRDCLQDYLPDGR